MADDGPMPFWKVGSSYALIMLKPVVLLDLLVVRFVGSSGLNRTAEFGVRISQRHCSLILRSTMDIAEKINEQVQRLPEQTQAEVLDFVEYLLTKTERERVHEEDQEWSQFSLTSAMRGLEDEAEPEYTEGDLEEQFSGS